MATPTKSAASQTGAVDVLAGFLPPPHLFPDEDTTSYEGLRDILMSDLAPQSPYERVLAQNLVDLEWQGLRHRRFRDHLIRASYRNIASEIYDKKSSGLFLQLEPTEEAMNFAFELVSSDPVARGTAEDQLAELEISPTEILAKAYKALSRDLDPHERQLAEIEVRRRRLLEDFDLLKSTRAMSVVDDAVIVEGE
jgi:hypothetical protein